MGWQHWSRNAGPVPDRSDTAVVAILSNHLHREVFSSLSLCAPVAKCPVKVCTYLQQRREGKKSSDLHCQRQVTNGPCPAQKQTTFYQQLGNTCSRGSRTACMQVNMHEWTKDIIRTQGTILCGQPAQPREPDRSWGRLAPGLASPIASQSPLCSHGSLFPSCPRGLRHKPSTAPSVTPESRRGHPNRLAEPLAVAPWALLDMPAHARRGLQLLAASLCGPRMGLLMSLALRLRWHWTRKSGPAEGPQRSSPSLPSI